METIHASCVALGGHGVLIRGPSGAGKSDLALRLIDEGAHLVADDRVTLAPTDGVVVASAPSCLAGLLEVRGLGIFRIGHQASVPLRLVADLSSASEIERMPDAGSASTEIVGLPLPRAFIAPFEASAVAKLRLALSLATSPELQRMAAES